MVYLPGRDATGERGQPVTARRSPPLPCHSQYPILQVIAGRETAAKSQCCVAATAVAATAAVAADAVVAATAAAAPAVAAAGRAAPGP